MKKNYFVIFIILFGPLTLFSQKEDISKWPKEEQNLFESANSLFEEKIYNVAYERFSGLSEKHPEDLHLKYLTGICGIYVSDKYDEALSYLTEVYSKNKKAADIEFYLAQLYHRTQQFDKSIETATKLLANPKTDTLQKKTLEQLIKYCDNGKILIQNPLTVNIQNIGSPPNSEASEYSPVITSDEETLIFTYRGKNSSGGLRDIYDKPNPYGFYYEDIFLTRKLDGKWQTPESIGENNTESNDAVIALSNDGQQLFIFRANVTDGGDIYVSQLKGTTFEVAEKLRGDINTSSWEGSISLSGDQKKVIFSSERPGGFGGKDLYSAVKLPDDSWGNVKNLGDKINTAFDDDAPFLHPDGRTLIFSSKGHNSMGEYDIFLSDLDEADSTWKKPVNIGYPINTTGDDIYYVLSADGKRGYYATAKKGGFGDKDIYQVEPAISSKKSFLTIIKGRITENSNPFAANITVSMANDGRNYGTFKSNLTSGSYLVSLPSGFNYKLSFNHPVFGEKTYTVITEKLDGYAEKIVNVTFGENDTTSKHQTIVLETKKDSSLVAPAITGISKEELKKMSREELVKKFGELKIKGLTFFVQVGAYRHPENYKPKNLLKICKLKRNGVILEDVTIIVVDKELETLKEADQLLKQVKDTGQKDAFITANYNGKRYYLKDLIEMEVLSNPAL